MAERIRVGRRIGRIVSTGYVMSVVALACTAVAARSATPIVSVGPTSSPTGGTATATMAPSGQTDACLDQQHSGANPSTSSVPGVVQIADSSCAAPSGSGTPTTAAAPSTSGSGGGGSAGTSAASGSDGGGGSGAAPAGGGAQSRTQTTTSS